MVEKKKNSPESTRQQVLIVCLILLLALAMVAPFIVQTFLERQATPLMATNPLVITALVETNIAGTQQYFLTTTPTPVPIPT